MMRILTHFTNSLKKLALCVVELVFYGYNYCREMTSL